MMVDIEQLDSELIGLINSLEMGKSDSVIITRNGQSIAKIIPVGIDTSKRLGVAKEQMKGRSITLEELNSIDVSDLF